MRSLLGRFHRPNARSQTERLFMLNNLGDGSTLSLDFTTGVLDSRLTFTRSTTGTYINSSGYVTSAAINAPRFDYDPTTTPPTPRGLLLEGSANNIATYSNDFSNAIWTLDTSGGTIPAVSTVSQTGPDGASTVTRITFNKTGGVFSRIRQTLSGTASQPYTMSVWMKANTASGGASTQNVGLRIGADSAGFNCVVTTTWKRFQYTYTLSGTDAAAQIMLWDSIIGNDETADVLVYGCMIESGSSASSYIPTGASTGNRAKDVCNITGSNFSSWFVDGPGTIVAQSDNVKSNTRNLLCEFNKDASNYIQMGVGAGAGSGEALFYNPDGFSQSGTTPSLNTAYKSAYVWDTNYFKMCLNGTLGSADTIGNIVSSGMVNLSIGGDLTNPTDVYIKNGHIRSLKYWPTRLPDAQLQALTT